MSSLSSGQQLLVYVFLLLILLSLRLTYIGFRQSKFSHSKGCKAAQNKLPVRDPFVGLDFIYDCLFAKPVERYLDSSFQTFRKLGSTYISKRWTWETVFTCDSRNVKHILSSRFEDFELPRLRVNAIVSLLGDGIFTLNGKSWSHTRSILRPNFSKQDKEHQLNILEGHFQALLQRIPRDGDVVDLQPLFFWLTMDFATEFLMGHSTHVLKRASSYAKEQQFVDDYMTCSTEIVRRMQLGPLQSFSFDFSAAQAKRRVFRYIDDFINESLEQKQLNDEDKVGCDILSELATLIHDREKLRDQILHVLVASRDTTASLLSNLFFMLSRHPKIYDKLREEIISIAGEEPATSSELARMEYLKWCVQESLRLHPVIPTNAREASKDTTLPYGGGKDGNSPLLVKRGTLVMYNVYALHRDERVFGPDPEAFIPERWQGLRPGWGYLPFNGGPRICIGQKFALLETHFLVSRMIQIFKEMEAADNNQWVELYALATSCKDGVKVRLNRS